VGGGGGEGGGWGTGFLRPELLFQAGSPLYGGILIDLQFCVTTKALLKRCPGIAKNYKETSLVLGGGRTVRSVQGRLFQGAFIS